MDNQLLHRVDGTAKSLSRPRSWVINQALESFVDYEEWFKQEVTEGLAEVERKDTASTDKVRRVFHKWGVDASSTDSFVNDLADKIIGDTILMS